MTQPLKIGVLGSGSAGRTLANGFLDHAHRVMIGSRTPDKLRDWLREAGREAQVGTFAQAAQFGELIVLSVNGRAAEDVIRLADLESFAGKIVLDASDPLDFSSGRPGLFVGTTDGEPDYHLPHLPPAVAWSPDSTKVLTHRTDERSVRQTHLVEARPATAAPR